MHPAQLPSVTLACSKLSAVAVKRSECLAITRAAAPADRARCLTDP